MSSVLAAAATGKREAAALLRAQNAGYAVSMIARFWKKFGYVKTSKEQELVISTLLTKKVYEDFSADELACICLQASHKAFGDPMALLREQLKLRQYSTPYYNPTGSNISVYAMGLPDEDGQIINSVVPGGIIGIPHGYTEGGKFSTVQGVAPQLKPMPRVQEDMLLDISPTTYIEWITYTAFKLSQCCNKAIFWSDAKQSILCEKCRKEIQL